MSLLERAWPLVQFGLPGVLSVSGYFLNGWPVAATIAVVTYVALGVQRDRRQAVLAVRSQAAPSTSLTASAATAQAVQVEKGLAHIPEGPAQPQQTGAAKIEAHSDLTDAVAALTQAVEELRAKQSYAILRIEELQARVFTAFRARDAEATLKALDPSITKGFTSLLKAGVSGYPTEEAWLRDYEGWTQAVDEFWVLVRGWTANAPNPLAPLSPSHEHQDSVPELLVSHKAQQAHRALRAVMARHTKQKNQALEVSAVRQACRSAHGMRERIAMRCPTSPR